MSWKPSNLIIALMCAAVLFAGCTPSTPMYTNDAGDLSYYLDQATKIDYPDVTTATSDEVTLANRPITVIDPDFDSYFDLTLEDCVGIALQNSKVLRGYGTPSLQGTRVAPGQDNLANGPAAAGTIYNVAIRESEPGFIGTPGQISAPGSITTNTGLEGNQGVEAALADFDAQLTSSLLWTNSDEPRNSTLTSPLNPSVFQQDQVQWQTELVKKTANGTQIFFRNVNAYTDNNIPLGADSGFQELDSWYRTTLEVELRQPLLRGRGAFIQRMPIVISRIGTDQELANLDAVLQNMVTNVEIRYWELYCAYRNFDSALTGRRASLTTWRIVNDNYNEGADVNKQQLAEASEQYHFFDAQVIDAYNNLLVSENNLRFLLGISTSDCRIIRPVDEAVMAPIEFDWCASLCEALTFRPELRQERWEIKKKELSLAYSKNSLLPELNVTGLYRWLGLGNLYGSSETSNPFPGSDSAAVNNLYGGDYQEFQLGVEGRMPIGFRRELSNVRNAQLKLARELARLEDMELDVSRELADAIRALAANQRLMQINFNRWKQTKIEEDHFKELEDAGVETLETALEAQRRRAQSEQAFYNALCEYNKVIALIHRRKGTILAYNGIDMGEGPWPGKAYKDAQSHARRRGASEHLDYGWSRPQVISRGSDRPTAANRGIPMAGGQQYVAYQQGGQPGVQHDGVPQTYDPYNIAPEGLNHGMMNGDVNSGQLIDDSIYQQQDIFSTPRMEPTPAAPFDQSAPRNAPQGVPTAPRTDGRSAQLENNPALLRDARVQQVSFQQEPVARNEANPESQSLPTLQARSGQPVNARPDRDLRTAPQSNTSETVRPMSSGNLNWENFGMSNPDRSSETRVKIKTDG